MRPILTVNIIEVSHGRILQVVSFPETPGGNYKAGKLFKRMAKENDKDMSEKDLDKALKDGEFDTVEGYSLFLVHSNAD